MNVEDTNEGYVKEFPWFEGAASSNRRLPYRGHSGTFRSFETTRSISVQCRHPVSMDLIQHFANVLPPPNPGNNADTENGLQTSECGAEPSANAGPIA